MLFTNAGATGIAIVCDFPEKVYPAVDGIHIMAMGYTQGTDTVIEFVHILGKYERLDTTIIIKRTST
jgi:hypothetical protein